MKKFLLFAAAAMVAAGASAATEWVSLIEGGNAADGETASLQAGWSGPAKVVDNPKGDGKVFTMDIPENTPNDAGNYDDWKSQMFICFNEPVQEGDVIKVEFDHYCSDSRTVGMQAQGDRGSYQGNFAGFDAKSEWQKYSQEITVTEQYAGADGFKNIAVCLSGSADAAVFYINNLVVAKQVEGEEPGGKTLDMLPSLSNDAYDAETKTITFASAWGWVNWWFGEGDYSEYESFVLEFEPVTYTVQVMIQYNEGDDVAVQAQAGESKLVAPLDPARKNSIKQIAIQNSEPGTLTLKAAYFDASAGVNAVSAPVVNSGVYNLQGVKVANSLEEVAVPGLYICNGKKIIKK